MKIRKIIFAIILSCSLSAYASLPTDVGGGGFVIKCTDELGDDHYRTFDVWEQSKMLQVDSYGLKGKNWKEKVHFALNRLKRVDYLFALAILDVIKDLEKNMGSYLVKNLTFPDIKDYTDIVISKSCVKIPAAFQIKVPFYGQKKFYFSLDVWRNLDEFNKASLVLHEAIYKVLKDIEHVPNSDFVRYFNFFISSDLMESVSREEYFEYRYSRQLSLIKTAKLKLKSLKLVILHLFSKNPEAEATKKIVSRLVSWIPLAIMAPNHPNHSSINIDTIDPLNLDYITSVLQDERVSFDSLINVVLFRNNVTGIMEDILNFVEMKELLEASNLTIENINNLFKNVDDYLDNEWNLFLEMV